MKSLFYLLQPEQSNLGMSVQIIGLRIYNGVLSILTNFLTFRQPWRLVTPMI